MQQKILIVGGAGYVGCVLVRELLEHGYAVRILDRLYYGEEGLADVRDRVELIQADMRRMPSDVFQNIAVVINLGGLSNDPTAEYNPEANYEMNTLAAIRLAEQCIANGVPRYVLASSCSIYDRGVGNDELDVLLDETSEVYPKAAYSSSKREAEVKLLEMKSERFVPVILRKGTIYGFSPRMRYDLVINTFVRDALSKGFITLHFGGEMWRPLVDVRDVAQAYILALQADVEKVSGQIFNVVYRNFRISELALRACEALKSVGVQCDLRPDYSYRGVRNYRVSGKKIERMLGFRPKVDIQESVVDMVENIRTRHYLDFDSPQYYNIQWMRLLEQAKQVIDVTGSVFKAERE